MEAVIVASIMVSAVAFVVTREDPGISSSLDAIEAIHTQRARDFMLTAEELPSPQHCRGDTQLENLIFDGIESNHAAFIRKRDRFFPLGTDVNMYLDNGEEYFPLHVIAPDFVGSGATRTVWPDWEATEIVFNSPFARGTESLVGDVVASREGVLIRPRGEALQFVATFESAKVAKEVRAASLSALPSPEPGVPQVSWIVPVIEVGEDALMSRRQIPLELTYEAPRAGHASLVLQVPPGWILSTPEPSSPWQLTPMPNSDDTFQLTATETVDRWNNITLKATPPPTVARPFDVFSVAMQGSSFSLAELVITYLGTTDTSLPRELRTTVPNPLPFGEDATFGVVFVNGGDEVDLTQLDIEVPGGYDLTHNRGRGAELFADAPIQVLTGPVEGEWRRIDAKHLRWFGNETVPANGALDWTIRVRITDDASQLTAYEPYALPHASLTFENGFEINGTRWGPSPGIIRLRVPPDDLETIGVVDGYPHALPGEYAINGSLGSATARLYGDGTYTVTPASQDLVRLDSSVANSSLRVNERLVPLGEIVRVEASLESLLSLAAQQGAAEVNLSFELYPPPMIGCAPVKTWTRTLRSLGQESATLTMMWDGGTGAGGSFAALPSSRVAKFDFKGDRVWASQLSGEVLAWTKVPDASPTPALVVGLSSGEVCSVGALLGEVRWCQSVGDEVRAAYARDQEILAGSSDGALVMLTPAGDIIRTGAALAPVRAIEPLGAGWGVLTDDGLERFDAGLSRTALAAAPAPLAFAEGSGAVRVAYSGGVLVLGEADLAVVERFDYPTPAVAAGGDVDGDGVMDLAIASDRGHVVLHGGVSGKAWETDASTAILPDNPPHTMEIDGFDFTVNPVGSVSDAIEKYCRPKSISGYGDAEICSFPEVVTSKQLSIGQGRVYHRFDFAADEKITAYDADGVGATIDVPAANHHDAGLLAGRRVVQAADVEGNLTLVDVETGVVVYQKAASDLGSTIGASFRIPAGGFFGSHLIIAKLTWPVEGTQQEARLLDWFEVVASDGSPVTKPAYRAVLIVKDRGG